MRRSLLALLLLPLASAFDQSKPVTRPIPTPGPQVVVQDVTSISGDEKIERGERIRFAVAGTGAGTHFSSETFLDSKAFSDLRVVAVVSSRLLYAQGTVGIGASQGHKDLAVVSGAELAVDPWAFVVQPKPLPTALGAPPVTADGTIDQAGRAALFSVTPKDSAVRTIVLSVERDRDAPADFKPSLEIYSADGRLEQAPASGCGFVEVRSRVPLFVRIADPLHGAGADRRFHFVATYGDPWLCKKLEP